MEDLGSARRSLRSGSSDISPTHQRRVSSAATRFLNRLSRRGGFEVATVAQTNPITASPPLLLSDLPSEILLKIFELFYPGFLTLFSLRLTCKRFRDISSMVLFRHWRFKAVEPAADEIDFDENIELGWYYRPPKAKYSLKRYLYGYHHIVPVRSKSPRRFTDYISFNHDRRPKLPGCRSGNNGECNIARTTTSDRDHVLRTHDPITAPVMFVISHSSIHSFLRQLTISLPSYWDNFFTHKVARNSDLQRAKFRAYLRSLDDLGDTCLPRLLEAAAGLHSIRVDMDEVEPSVETELKLLVKLCDLVEKMNHDTNDTHRRKELHISILTRVYPYPGRRCYPPRLSIWWDEETGAIRHERGIMILGNSIQKLHGLSSFCLRVTTNELDGTALQASMLKMLENSPRLGLELVKKDWQKVVHYYQHRYVTLFHLPILASKPYEPLVPTYLDKAKYAGIDSYNDFE